MSWCENLGLVECVFSKIKRLNSFLVFSQLNEVTACASNSKRVQWFLKKNICYLVKTGHKNYVLKPFDMKNLYYDENDPNDIEIIDMEYFDFNFHFFISGNNGWSPDCAGNEYSKDIKRILFTNVRFSKLRCARDYRYVFVWPIPDTSNYKPYLGSLIVSCTPYDVLCAINYALYNVFTSLKPGTRVMTVYDITQTNSLPMYILF